MIYVAAVCLLTLLGVSYVKLYDVVKAHQPEALPRFYLIMTVKKSIGPFNRRCSFFHFDNLSNISYALRHPSFETRLLNRQIKLRMT